MSASQFRPKYAKVRVHFSKFVVRPKVRAQDFHIIINARVRICENCQDARAIQCCSCRNRIGFASPHFRAEFIVLEQTFSRGAARRARLGNIFYFLFFWSNIFIFCFSSALKYIFFGKVR